MSNPGNWQHSAQETGRKHKNTTQHRKLNKGEQHRPHKKVGVNPGAREGQAVPPSYKTLAMLLIY
jgi:hypothetical protein